MSRPNAMALAIALAAALALMMILSSCITVGGELSYIDPKTGAKISIHVRDKQQATVVANTLERGGARSVEVKNP